MKTLLDKLGYTAGTPAQAWQVPEQLRTEMAPLQPRAGERERFRIAFVRDRAELERAVADVARLYAAGELLWLCYPKKSGRIRTDLTRDVGWEQILELGLLPVAQVALDQDWSALRFRLREEISSLTRKTPTGGRGARAAKR